MKVVLKVTEGPHTGKQFAFDQHDNFIVGRHSCAHFRLAQKDPFFSRLHFMIEANAPFCRLMDMGSRNGTVVNGQVVKRADLKSGDEIRGGQTVIKVSIVTDDDDDSDVTPLVDGLGSLPAEGQRTRSVTMDEWSNATAAEAAESVDDAALKETLEANENQGFLQSALEASNQPAFGSPPEPGESVWSTNVDPACDRPVQTPSGHQLKTTTGEPDSQPQDRGLQLTDDQLALLPPNYERQIATMEQTIPGFLLVDEIGRGGMGVVYRAIQQSSGKVAAVKAIQPAGPVSDSDIERFLREAEIQRQLEHPNIVGFWEMGETEGLLYFVMDFVHGTDALKLTQSQPGLMPISNAVGIICQLLSALDFAHEKGFVHRDIKPANLLLTKHEGRGLVRLADFGLARTYQTSRMSGLTVMGETGGTPAFMPPEQITHYRDAKPPVDQYAAAATLYYLLTKQCIHNFPRDICQQLVMIMQEDCVPITQRRPDIPPKLGKVIHHALNRDPGQRFPGVRDFRKYLLPFSRTPKT